MIDPKAEPIDNRNPYKRIDLAKKPKRDYPAIITKQDYANGVIPDEMLYEYDFIYDVWRLKS